MPGQPTGAPLTNAPFGALSATWVHSQFAWIASACGDTSRRPPGPVSPGANCKLEFEWDSGEAGSNSPSLSSVPLLSGRTNSILPVRPLLLWSATLGH